MKEIVREMLLSLKHAACILKMREIRHGSSADGKKEEKANEAF